MGTPQFPDARCSICGHPVGCHPKRPGPKDICDNCVADGVSEMTEEEFESYLEKKYS